jgi:serine/threonine protein kinase
MSAFTADLELLQHIGAGFFGDVFEGRDPVHGRVAAKVLRPLVGESPAHWAIRSEGLLREAQLLRSANHENVVRVHHIVRSNANNRLHMVTEFCDGGSLEKIYQQRPFGLTETRRILTHICSGLEAIHARNMLHRDLKPANILRGGSTFKIGDFGLVTTEIISGYGFSAGYQEHFAPEVHLDHVTSVRTDIWSLGVTMYRILHGDEFYRRHMKSEIIELARSGTLAQHLIWLPHIPAPWRRVIRKALHKKSSRRFQSALELCQALAGLPVEPDWNCVVQPEGVQWTLERRGQLFTVKWQQLSPREHRWRATKEGKRRITLYESRASIGKAKLLQELDIFFQKIG